MAFIIVSPLLGFLLGSLLMVIVAWVCRQQVAHCASTAGSGGCNWCPRALYSLGHGGNDAQKTIGLIWMLLIAAGMVGAG